MTDQDLKNKYQPVADFMSQNGFQIQHFHLENGKAVLTATAPTEHLMRSRQSIRLFRTCSTTSPLDREACTWSSLATAFQKSRNPTMAMRMNIRKSQTPTTLLTPTKFKQVSNSRFQQRKLPRLNAGRTVFVSTRFFFCK